MFASPPPLIVNSYAGTAREEMEWLSF